MNFSKIIGKIDDKLVAQAEEKLSAVFLELGTRYDNTCVGSGIGGDPLIFSLLYPMEHICTLNMPTAATDGKRYYWNPKFVLKQDRIGLRIIAAHEAGHAIYMHPQRRGSRNPKLWNIAVDYIVNGMVMEDFTARNFDAAKMFSEHLGNFCTLEQYAAYLKDPFNPSNDLPGADVKPPDIKLPAPDEDRELTEEEQKALEEYEKKVRCFFADPNLTEEMKSPERIYDYLYSLLPKCPDCGRVGVYTPPKQNQSGDQGEDSSDGGKDDKKSKGKGKGKNKKSEDKGDDSEQSDSGCSDGNCSDQNHSHGQGDQSCGCPTCGGGYDVFGFGDTLDEHMDTEESEEKLAKRISDAMEAAKKMAGHVPASLEAELGKLTEPKITWTDVIRGQILRARSGNDRNDWTRFRSRPLFAGLMTPKRKSYSANFGCLVDCSGSMSADDVAFGLSQLKALDDRSEGTLVACDSDIYWDKATKIRRCNEEELTKFKRVGLGGTMFAPFFSDYEKEIGKCDFLIVITDGYLLETDIAAMQDPGVPVFWLVTSDYKFNAPFGKVMCLR
jgi:predicted metal-dependent peptidase